MINPLPLSLTTPKSPSEQGPLPASQRPLQVLRHGQGHILPPGPRHELHADGQPLRRRAPRTTAPGQPVRL
jgi:hypothetical protein